MIDSSLSLPTHGAHPCTDCEELFLDNGGRCGWWLCRPSRTLLRRHKGKHVLQRPKGLAFDLALWERVRNFVDYIVCCETDRDTIRVCDRGTFETDSFVINRGFGEQRVLPLNRWEDASGPQLQPALF